jgi:hypothetical protein
MMHRQTNLLPPLGAAARSHYYSILLARQPRPPARSSALTPTTNARGIQFVTRCSVLELNGRRRLLDDLYSHQCSEIASKTTLDLNRIS